MSLPSIFPLGRLRSRTLTRSFIIFALTLILPALVPADDYPSLDPMLGAAEARTPIVPAGETFRCTPTAVYDGDGPIWCAEGPKVRIAGVAAREIDGSCRSNQPCPPVGGIDARDRVVHLFGGPKGKLRTGHILVHSPTMSCLSEGSGVGSRTAAWCVSPVFGDLSCAVVRAGGAIRWPRYWRDHHCR
jgi:hypothetical protein